MIDYQTEVAQSAGAAEYTDFISVKECHRHDTKQSDEEATIKLVL